jgi:phage nucleotide-binding protein
MNISSTKDATSHGVKMMIYGQAGVGKTCLAATTGTTTVILSAEAGLLSLRGVDIPVIVINDMKDMREAYKYLLNEGAQYETVILDSLSEIAEKVLAYEMTQTRDPRKAFGEMATTMVELVKAYRDLPGRNIVMIAKVEKQKDELEGKILYSPSFPGQQLAAKLPYLFDELLYMRADKGQDGGVVRSLQTQTDWVVMAKDRSGCLEPFEAPDLAAIFAKIAA